MSPQNAFVGRGGELALLDEELERARAGEPRLVWLSGEAGIGKTTLLRRFVAKVSGARLLWAGGDESETQIPYGVLTQLLTGVPVSAELDLRRDADPLAVGAALLSGLGALQASGPVIVVVDDAQWADERSTQALVFVLRRLRSDQVLVLLSARPDAPLSPAPWERALALSQLTRRVSLGGLTAVDLQRLSPTVDGVLLSPAAGRRLHEHTGGHPLYARALLEELPAEALTETSGVLPAPRSLASLVLVRLAKLSPAAQSLVLAVAVLGSRCALSDAVRVADVADPVTALDEAVRAGLLVHGPPGHPREVAFPHQLIRGAIYADLPPASRHALHGRAATVLAVAPALAHRVAAVVGPDPALADELETLGRHEQEQQSWHAAADHLVAAADLSDTAAEQGRRRVAAAGAMIAGGEIDRAVRFEPRVRAAPAGPARSRVLGQIAIFTGRLALARDELSVALQLDAAGGGAGEVADRGTASAYLGLLALIEGQAEEAVDSAMEALMADPLDGVAAVAGFALMLGLATQGRQSEAIELIETLDAQSDGSSAATLQRAGLRSLLNVWSSQESAAVPGLTRVLRETPPGALMQGRILLLSALSEALYRIGDWDGAATQSELAISLAHDAGVVIGIGIHHAVASYVAAGRGLWETAEAQVAVAVRSAEALPWWANLAYAATARASLAQAKGDYAAMLEALRAFDDPAVLARVNGLGSLAWRALLVEAWLGLGQPAAAAVALAGLESRLGQREPGWAVLEALRLRAWLAELQGDLTSARQAYEQAMAVAEETPAALSRGRLETAYGRFLLSRGGERRRALDVLRTAHERLERLRAPAYLAVCDELLHTAGLRPPAVGDPFGFTTQELAVARLVAAGRTNSEAGLELFITSSTVAFHLSNIYAKAGIGTRRELAERFPQLLG